MEDFLLSDELQIEDGLRSLHINEDEDDVTEIDICDDTFLNDVLSDCSSPFDFHGFNSPQKENCNILLNLMQDIESEIEEKDVIDGVEFLSFTCEQELMDYSRLQQDQRAIASQSDDGLEILDDGSFSDISSNHAIVPTKTKDITRIKGWRNKHFAGIHLCDDSGSSLRNEDDGFGDDFEIKSVRDESSEEVESVDYVPSTTSKCGSDAESCYIGGSSDIFSPLAFGKDNFTTIDSSEVEDSNAVDNTEESGFSFRSSSESLSFQKSFRTKPTASDSELSFDDQLPDKHLSLVQDQSTPNKSIDPFLLPLAVPKSTQDRKYKILSENRVVYKPRVKLSFLDSISRKLNAFNDSSLPENSTPTVTLPKHSSEPALRWHVPREKLLSGNIYDLELKSPDVTTSKCKFKSKSSHTDQTSESIRPRLVPSPNLNQHSNAEITIKEEDLWDEETYSVGSAFQSSTLDRYTESLGELKIDFVIPKLDAAEGVTHQEIQLPKQDSLTHSLPRVKVKSVDKIKAKTLAEKRRLIAEMNQRTKRKKKLSLKLRASQETATTSSETVAHTHLVESKGKLTKSCKAPQKKLPIIKEWFDKRGVITYGREKPLIQRLAGTILSQKKLPVFNKSSLNTNEGKKSSSIGMIVNIGYNRPLYKETADSLNSFLRNNEEISEEFAKFAMSAVQKSTEGPFTVTRFLIPVVSENLKELMNSSKTVNTRNRGKMPKKILVRLDKNQTSEVDTLNWKESIETEQVDVHNLLSEIISFVECKELFDDLECKFDPDVPIPVEKETSTLLNFAHSPVKDKKTKKTKLQRQIEALGGTFITVQGEEGNEENLSRTPESEICSKEYCRMGCVCFVKTLKDEHCGKETCMFFCTCPPSSKKTGCEIKSKIWLLPEVLRQQSKSQSKMAPIEREYHQTVIMSKDNKTITIETKRKRERKIPSKFKDEILLDYGNDRDYDDCSFLISGTLKQSSKEQAITQDISDRASESRRCSNPIISSLNSFLKRAKLIYDSKTAKIVRQCYIKIENNDAINQMASTNSFIPGVYFDKLDKNDRGTNVKSKSRNVAVKKTGGVKSHDFDVENYCTRTFGVSQNYQERNLMCKIRTKNMMLYVAVPHGLDSKDSHYFSDNSELGIIKEDLQVDTGPGDEVLVDNEPECLEKISQEEDSGLAINFICSLSPEIFEKQDSPDFEESANKLPLPVPDNSIVSIEKSTTNKVLGNINSLRGKTEQIVYATLPTTETECKWWVVEMDSNKFTNLVYFSDKRCLNYQDMLRAIFKAEFGSKTVRIPLRKPHSLYEDKFGAYAVPGHKKHLMFFGPYEINDSHGITAIILDHNVYKRVPFASKFSESEGFKTLDTVMSHDKDSTATSQQFVKAVWWYSTSRKEPMNKDNETRDEDVRANSDEGLYITSEYLGNHQEDDICLIESEPAQNREIISTAITVDTDDEDYLSVACNEVSQVKTERTKETPTDKVLQIQEISTNPKENLSCNLGFNEQEKSCQNKTEKMNINGVVSKTENLERTGNPKPRNTKIQPKTVNSITIESNNKVKPKDSGEVKGISGKKVKNVTKMGISLLKKNTITKPLISYNKLKDLRHNMSIIRLKKKIADLDDVITSTNIKHPKVITSTNIKHPKTKIDPVTVTLTDTDDSSSFSDDDDLYDDSNGDVESSPESTDSLAVSRVVHPTVKKLSKPKEPVKPLSCSLPSNLVLKKPIQASCPELALLCKTPGVGYIPVTEFDHTKLVIQDPAFRSVEHQFQDQSQASKWLNNYFVERFTFKKKFKMQWLLMKGSIIRRLQPLNREIFKFPSKSLVISSSGLEAPVWEKQTQHNQREQERRLNLAKLRCELKELVLPKDIDKCSVQMTINSIAGKKLAVQMVEAQRLLAMELSKASLELSRKKSILNDKLKSFFADLTNPEEKKKALELSKFIKCDYHKEKDLSEHYLELMKTRELKIVKELRKRPISSWNILPTKLKRKRSHHSSKGPLVKSSSGAWLGQERSAAGKVQPTEGVLVKKKPASVDSSTKANTPDVEILASDSQESFDVIQITDSDEEKNEEDNKNEDKEEVIEIKSDEEGVVLLSDEEQDPLFVDEDIEMLSPKVSNQSPKPMFPKPKKKLPPSTMLPVFVNVGMAPGTAVQKVTNSSPLILLSPCEDGESHVEERKSPEVIPAMSEESKRVSPVAMVIAASVLAERQSHLSKDVCQPWSQDPIISSSQHLQTKTSNTFLPINASSRVNISTATFLDGLNSSQTQQKSLLKPNLRKLSPQPKKSFKAFTRLASFANVSSVQQNLIRSKLLNWRNVTPMGKINQGNKYSKVRGKPILLCKSESGFKIAKLPLSNTQSPRVLPLRVTPAGSSSTDVATTQQQVSTSSDRANTVTLYHPSEEISETRTVQFASLNKTVYVQRPLVNIGQPSSVENVEHSSVTRVEQTAANNEESSFLNSGEEPPFVDSIERPSVIKGPKIRRPRDDAVTNIKVLLPKRN